MTAITITRIPKILKKPFLEVEFKKRERTLSKRTIIGAVIFGLGEGLSDQCPSSAMASIGVGNIPILLGVISMFLRAFIMGKYFS